MHQDSITQKPALNLVVEWLGRLGYAAKAFLYVIIGGLAAMQALGMGGDVTGSRGALKNLNQQTLGDPMTYIVAAGLLAYMLWRWAQGFLDVENKGNDAKGLIKRAGLIISGGLYGFVAVFAIRLSLSAAGQTGQSNEPAEMAMQVPGGGWLVALTGIGFLLTGLYQLYRAYSYQFTDHWKRGLSGNTRNFATRVSRFGIFARSIVFVFMGGFITISGFNHNPNQTLGFGETLQSIADIPWLLAITAIGLLCYSIYGFVNAIYREIPAR